MTPVELIESVRRGGPEALVTGQADLAIINPVPPGFLGESLMRARFIPAAHPDHPLHRLGRPPGLEDLRGHRHLVVRETGSRRDSSPSLEAPQRWTVSNMSTSIGAACRGYGFAWFPEDKIRAELREGSLKPLPMKEGGARYAELYLVLADRDAAGPGVLRLVEIIREEVARDCAAQDRSTI